jgi:hypothetical protein
MQKEERQKRVRVRKNFLFTLVIVLLTWVGVFAIIFFLDPDKFQNILLLLFTVFVGLLLTFATIFENRRRGFLTAIVIISYLILRYFKIGTFYNLLLILGAATSFEIYFSKHK